MDEVFKAISDPTRRLIIEELAAREGQTLFELCVRLVGNHRLAMSRQAIEKHLGVLEEAGLVRSGRRGKYRVLSLNREPLREIGEQWLSKVVGNEQPPSSE